MTWSLDSCIVGFVATRAGWVTQWLPTIRTARGYLALDGPVVAGRSLNKAQQTTLRAHHGSCGLSQNRALGPGQTHVSNDRTTR
eukprot:470713-Prymnesium_polylepis.1